MSEYKIQLGIALDKEQLNSVKQSIDKVAKNRDIDINIDFNIKDASKLVQVGKDIDDIKAKLKDLNNVGSIGKGKSLISVDAKSVEASLDKINKQIKTLQNSFGRVDKNKGTQSLLTTVNKIRKALEEVSGEFASLNKNLAALSNKNFSLNFDFSMGKNSKSPEQVLSEIKMLEKEAKEYENYFHRYYKLGNRDNVDPIRKLMMDYMPDKKVYIHQLKNMMLSGEPSVKQIAAYKEYIGLIKEAARISPVGIAAESIVKKNLGDSEDFVKVKNEVSETEQKLKELFSGGIDASRLNEQLDSIVADLKKIGDFIGRLDDNNSIDDLTLSFNNLAETLNRLMTSADKIKRIFDSGLVDIPVERKLDDKSQEQTEQIVEQKRLEAQQAQETANVVVQAEEKKQQEFEETVIEASKAGDVFENMRKQLSNMNFSDSDIDSIIRDIEKLGIVIDRITLSDNGDGLNISIKGKNDLKEAVTYSMKLGDNMEELEVTSKTVTHSFEKIANVAEKVRNKFKGANSNIDSDIIGSSGFDKEIVNVEAKFERLENKSIALTASLDELKERFRELKIAMQSGSDEEIIAANKKYEESLKRVNNQLDINIQKEKQAAVNAKLDNDRKNFQTNIDAYLKKYSAAAKKYGEELLELKVRAENCNRVELDGLIGEFKQLDRAIEASGLKSQNFFDRINTQIKRYSAYLSVAEVIMYATQALRDMFDQVVAIDSAMTELKKVTDEADAAYDKFLTNAAVRAKEIGTTIDGLVESTADFARLGYEFKDAQGLAEIANIYSVVGDDIDSVETATQSLISTLTAFKDEAGNLTNSNFALSIVDKMNEVSNNFAISSGGIGETLQRSASSMMAANNSLDETIALITAANTVVQDPASVGTAFKTISMRIRGAKTELEEAGLETEGMVESTAKLREEIMALTGVDIMLNENEFKSTYQIMEELASKWKNLTDIQQASVTELIAGKRQGNIVSSLMNNFNIAEEALETSLGSAGSAMKEHEKWQKSLEAQLLKLKAAWQGFAQSFMSSDFLRGALDTLINIVEVLTKLIDTIGVIPTIIGAIGIGNFVKTLLLLGGSIKSFKDILDILAMSFPNIARVATTFFTTLKSGTGILAALKMAFSGLWGVIASHPIMATVAAIGLLIVGISKLGDSEEELAGKVEEATSKFKEQTEELKKNKSSFKGEAARYAELSKGVSEYGENLSLTADEYAEYQGLANSIAEQVPSLVKGYDSQGNAILNVKNNVEGLIKAYENLIKIQNNELLREGTDGVGIKDIEKDFKEDVKDFDVSSDNINLLEKALNGNLTKDKIKEIIPITSLRDIVDALQKEGLAENVGTFSTTDTYYDAIAEAIKLNPGKVRTVINNFKSDFNGIATEIKTGAQAALSNAIDFSDSPHADMSGTFKNIAQELISGMSAEEFQKILNSGVGVEEYVNSMLNSFKQLEAMDEGKDFEAAFNLRTQFNNGEVSYGEYVKGIKEADALVNDLVKKGVIDNNIANQIKLSLNTDEVKREYDALLERLTSKDKDKVKSVIGLDKKAAEEFLNELTASEYAVAVDLIANDEIDFSKIKNIDDLRNYIKEQAKINEAMNFTIAIDVETESIEALNTAMAESVSAAGLSSESIAALKSRYAELASEGYDLSSMFEQTSNGIHLNREAIGEFEQALASKKLNETKEKLEVLKGRYDDLTDEINNCTDASKRAALYTEQQSIINKINDLGNLASQYKGLASAYNAWRNAEDAGSERDMYEGIIGGFEEVGDEISRGWIDDGTIKFLELLTGKTDLAGKSGKELKEIYDGLDKTIGNSGYSIRDFFTVDEDGNSTNTGVYNFLETVESFEDKLGDVIQRDASGNIIGFDFEVAGGDEAIAKTLGISEELVQIMVRAADDAGFVVNLEGAFTQYAQLKTEAEMARDALVELKEAGNESLKDIDVKFNLEATGQELIDEQKRAVELLDKFRKEDGTIDLNMEGAQQALDVAEYLTIKIDDLTEPKYMQIDTSQVDKNLQKPIEKMQEFERLSKQKHLLTLTGDKKKIKETEKQMEKIAKDLEGLSEETKIDLGIDKDWTAKEISEKLEKGEIEIPAELDVELDMSEDLKDMKLLLMKQLGLITKEEVQLKVSYDVDDSVVDKLTDEEKKVVIKYIEENKEEWDKYSKEEKTAIVKIIADGTDVEKWEAEEKEALVKYIVDGGNVEDWSPEAKYAFAKYLVDGGDPEKFDPEDKESWVVYKKDSKEPDSYKPNNHDSTVTYHKDSSDVDDYDPPDIFRKVIYTLTEMGKSAAEKRTGVKRSGSDTGKGHRVNGTANVNGTTGRAFKQGDWRTKKSETALTGELGQELVVTGNRWYTVGDNGAEFARIPKGSIVFNHRQTEELFKNGKVISDGGRGRALASGTAFLGGTEGTGIALPKILRGNIKDINKKTKTTTTTKKTKKTKETEETTTTTTTTSGSNGVGDGIGKVGGAAVDYDTKGTTSSAKNDFKETIDWIETAIDRIEREIDSLDQKANNVYKSWSSRNSALISEIGEVEDEINLQQKAYDRYMQQANSVGLSEDWAKKVRDGKVDIETIKDESLAEKIKDYETWYEKALDCKDSIEELRETEAELYAQRVENAATKYEGILGVIEHERNMIEEYISQSEANAQLVSADYYKALIGNENDTLVQLQNQKNDMLAEFEAAMASGTIEKGSEAFYDMVSDIDAVTLSIAESQTQIKEWEQTIQQLSWETFDLLQDKISTVTEEADFLIELMSSDKLYDDNGQLTDSGMATMGLHGQNYNTHMYQADQAGAEAARLKAEMEKDPFDMELAERYNEMIELQQEHILAAQGEKEAIRDMVEEGINLELDALQELIDKKNEALESERDLYEYQKKVKEQTKEIASLEKQIASYSGDTSEEAQQKIQQIKVDLESAKESLKETEWDKQLSDTQEMLDVLYEQYEEILNTRLDDIDALCEDMIAEINSNASTISNTISTEATNVGYTLSEEMKSIWSTSTTNTNGILTTYGEKFSGAQTTTNNTLNTINTNLQSMISQLNSIAKTNVKSASTSSAANSKEATKKEEPKKEPPKPTTPPAPTIKVGGKINAGSAKIFDYAGDTSGERQYYRNDPIYTVLSEKNGYLQVRYHKLKSGTTGWFKKSDVKAYATGAKRIDSNQWAWTQEGNKQEFIVRPSDGAILTPVARNDSVLNANASSNIWNMANSPAEFIKDNLGLGGTNIPNNSSVNNNVTQNFENITFSMPNVHSYNELIAQMQRDKNFEKLVLSMSVDRLAGKSSLAKNKSIR